MKILTKIVLIVAVIFFSTIDYNYQAIAFSGFENIQVYDIENGKKRPFPSAESFLKKGYSWNRIMVISEKEKYRTGEYL